MDVADREDPQHPMQPVVYTKGVVRFKCNAIVRYLLDAAARGEHNTLNTLTMLPFMNEDWNQFAQLIGSSVSVFGALSYAFPETVEAADREAEKLLETLK